MRVTVSTKKGSKTYDNVASLQFGQNQLFLADLHDNNLVLSDVQDCQVSDSSPDLQQAPLQISGYFNQPQQGQIQGQSEQWSQQGLSQVTQQQMPLTQQQQEMGQFGAQGGSLQGQGFQQGGAAYGQQGQWGQSQGSWPQGQAPQGQ